MLRPLVGDPLRFLSKKCETYYRGYRDTNTPYGVPKFVAVALPGAAFLATQASQKPDSTGDLSCSATKPATKQGTSIAPSDAKQRGGVLSQPASQRTLVNTRLTTSVRFCFLPDEKGALITHDVHYLKQLRSGREGERPPVSYTNQPNKR